jgi:hypothetical protein
MTNEFSPPRNEPEIMRAKGRGYVADCNRIKSKPYGTEIFQALELAEKAYKALGLPYTSGLNEMDRYPPDRFTWLCDDQGDAEHCVKIRDDRTGKVVVWPHWFG